MTKTFHPPKKNLNMNFLFDIFSFLISSIGPFLLSNLWFSSMFRMTEGQFDGFTSFAHAALLGFADAATGASVATGPKVMEAPWMTVGPEIHSSHVVFDHSLSILLFLPIIGCLLIFFIPSKFTDFIRSFSLTLSFLFYHHF